MIEIQIYEEAQKIIAEENFRIVKVEPADDGYLITLCQPIARDMSMTSWALLERSGFTEIKEDTKGKATGSTIWHHFGNQYTLSAESLTRESMVLRVEYTLISSEHVKDTVRVMNRLFNIFKARLEAE